MRSLPVLYFFDTYNSLAIPQDIYFGTRFPCILLILCGDCGFPSFRLIARAELKFFSSSPVLEQEVIVVLNQGSKTPLVRDLSLPKAGRPFQELGQEIFMVQQKVVGKK